MFVRDLYNERSYRLEQELNIVVPSIAIVPPPALASSSLLPPDTSCSSCYKDHSYQVQVIEMSLYLTSSTSSLQQTFSSPPSPSPQICSSNPLSKSSYASLLTGKKPKKLSVIIAEQGCKRSIGEQMC